MRVIELGAEQREFPEIRQLVLEASRALARLDAARLEELVLSCKALNRDLDLSSAAIRDPAQPARHIELKRQARDARRDLAVFARVLDDTRGNLNVVHRLREQRAGHLEYTVPPAASGRVWPTQEPGNGDN